MSFSAEWLALREPVDHRSTSAKLRAEVAQAFSQSAPLRIVDMGCGSGSNLRGLAPVLTDNQHWTLVDWDAALLSHARQALSQWADASSEDDGADPIRWQGRGGHRVARLLVICSGERTRTPIHGIKTRCPAFERPRTVRTTVSGFLFSSLSR